MSPGCFWRLSLVLPPFIACAGFAAYTLVGGASGSQPAFANAVSTALMVAVYGVYAGVWPAYALWAAAYLWFTRRLPAARLRAANCLYAPLTFVPVCVVGLYLARGIYGTDGALSLEWMGMVAGMVLILGYASVGVVVVLEALFRRFGWLVPVPAPADVT